jgi:hypothetical protein
MGSGGSPALWPPIGTAGNKGSRGSPATAPYVHVPAVRSGMRVVLVRIQEERALRVLVLCASLGGCGFRYQVGRVRGRCLCRRFPVPYSLFPAFRSGQAARALSTARLRVLPRFHLPPINVVVSHGPSEALRPGRIHLGQGFPLRCVQRFSRPGMATRRCIWQHNRYTRGQSVPVLSY